jgi:hypothetical protein
VLGEGARASRPGENARQIEDADARKRALGTRQGLGRAVGDADDLEKRQRRDGMRLLMRLPLLRAPRDAARHAGGGERLFERETVPAPGRMYDALAVGRSAEEADDAGAVMREVAVEIDPAFITCRVEAGELVRGLGRLRPVECEVAMAAQRRRGPAQIDEDVLSAAAAQRPEPGGGKSCRGKRGGASGADAVRCRQGRVGALECDPGEVFLGPAGEGSETGERILRHRNPPLCNAASCRKRRSGQTYFRCVHRASAPRQARPRLRDVVGGS